VAGEGSPDAAVVARRGFVDGVGIGIFQQCSRLISPVAGTVARFDTPMGLSLDRAANMLFVADSGNHAVRRIDLGSGEVTTIATGLANVTALALDSDRGTLYATSGVVGVSFATYFS
jgi:DNA-binding beta-propeller fold protein YncE